MSYKRRGPYKKDQSGTVTHRLPHGKIFKARQDLWDPDKWHIEVYTEGKRSGGISLAITSFNANAMASLLTKVNYGTGPKTGGKYAYVEGTRSRREYKTREYKP